MIALEELFVFHELKNQGLSISEIARCTGHDRKTVRKHLEKPLAAVPNYGPRQPQTGVLEPYKAYLNDRIDVFPNLSAKRLLREIQQQGYGGSYPTLTAYLRTLGNHAPALYERRFETEPGQQVQVDFAQFKAEFTAQPGVTRRIWLFTMVLGYSRWLWGQFCERQDLRTVLRMHLEMFDAMGGVPAEILYDRMRTAVIGEDAYGQPIYNVL